MREIAHKGLARLVGLCWSHVISSDNLHILESSSMQPDIIKREGLSKGMFDAIVTGIGWFAEHTYKAKELAIDNINMAIEAYNSGDNSWPYWLGRCFHFITDWLTPYHSIRVMTKYILGSENDIINKESKNGWDLVINILDKVSNLAKFKIEHDKFEEICEEFWKQNKSVIKNNFIRFKKKNINSIDLRLFSELMDRKQAKWENNLLDWIINCSDQEFAGYMTDIAKVIDVACRIVLE